MTRPSSWRTDVTEVALPRHALPEPETDDLGRYLEDTITIDWQTPSVTEQARTLLAGRDSPEDRVRALFEFVRDEIDHSLDVATDQTPCRASEVLAARTGLCYAKSHLLAALLRFAGHPAGFCYVRLADAERPGRFTLHGFNGVYWAADGRWIFLDPSGNRPGLRTECRFEAPFCLACFSDASDASDASPGEGFLPSIYKRPARRIIDLLEGAPDLAALRRNLPDSI